MAEALHPLGVTPLFRLEGGQQVVILLKGVIEIRPSKLWVNIVLLVLTFFSVLVTGASFSYGKPEITDIGEFLTSGLPFTISLLAILIAHESGHYLAARFHNTAVTLPYLIVPLTSGALLSVARAIGEFGAIVIVATHDLDLILELCPRTVMIDAGRLVADGATEAIFGDEALLLAHGLEKP